MMNQLKSMKPQVTKAVAGGLVGTVVMTLMMYFVAPKMTGRTMDIASELGQILGGSWAAGMAAHFFNGVVIFPVIYVFVLFQYLPGAPVLRGAIWGVLLWLAAQMVLMPMIGNGFFSSNLGPPSAVASLVSHLVYGGILGSMTGSRVRAAAAK